MTGLPEQRRVLITVRTYPTPAKKGVEVSCTAGVSDGAWIRLFPVPYRRMDLEKRFKKYQWIDLEVTKASDPRPESYTPNIDSIQIISDLPSSNSWKLRKDEIFHLRSHCHCCIERRRHDFGHPTLGLFKPAVIQRLIIEPDDPFWSTAQLARLRQASLFPVAPKQELEKIPFKFKYQFKCAHDECGSHTLSCSDWEMSESFRRWRQDYGKDWEEKFRQRYEYDMIELNDTHFYVGNLRAYPAAWNIVGLFYPRK